VFSLSGLLLVSFSLGLSNFAAAIGIGMGGVDANTRLKTGFIFGFFEALMPIVGLLIGQGLARLIGEIGHYVGAGLLVLTGAYTLWQVRKTNRDTNKTQGENQQVNVGRLLLSGFALSIDNLVVGFALSFYHVPFLLAAVMIAVVSVAMSLIGLELGNQLGKRFEQWSEVLSGVILILVGLAIGFGLF
jgi:manganese efflux pump family protein